MNDIEPITHLLALGVIILVAGILAVAAVWMALYDEDTADFEIEEMEPGEIDTTYYPDDEDSVIFRS